jgi:Flp pilus assembly pilin Flp
MISNRHRARQRPSPRGATRSPIPGLRAFIADERGQDVIEYGLLSALFGIVCIVVWISIQGRLAAAYTDYTSDGGRVQSIWQSPDPGGS